MLDNVSLMVKNIFSLIQIIHNNQYLFSCNILHTTISVYLCIHFVNSIYEFNILQKCGILHTMKMEVEKLINNKEVPKLKRTFMKDEAYNELRNWIITGKLQPGTQLRDQDLSETLGISRTPIREAILRLENDGLVVTKANRWTIVSPIDLEEAENIYTIVWTLETLALSLAFPHFTSKDISELEQYNENVNKIIKTGTQIEKLQADNEFHNKIIELSNNTELPKLLYNLKLRIQRIEIHYFSEEDSMQTTYSEHQRIIEHLKRQELDLALEALRENWKNSLNSIHEYIGKNND